MASLPRASWSYLGRHRSHWAPVTALTFALLEGGRQTLVSAGEDCCLVEYDLQESSVEYGVLLADDPRRLERAATAACFHPLLGDGESKDLEDRIVTANAE